MRYLIEELCLNLILVLKISSFLVAVLLIAALT